MYYILKHGGVGSGGVNFDAKVRRESFEPIDLFYAHVGSMDAYAKGLKIAAAIRADNALEGFISERYSSFDSGIGAKIETGEVSFADLETYMLEKGEADANVSGRQELLESVINRYIDRV
jgi:xylose isomerase